MDLRSYSCAKSNPPLQISRIRLPIKATVSDLGGWHTVLYDRFPAAEIVLDRSTSCSRAEPFAEILESTDYQYFLLDLNRHRWLAHAYRDLTRLVSQAESQGVRLVLYGLELMPAIKSFASRDAAISSCLQDWEQQIQTSFYW